MPVNVRAGSSSGLNSTATAGMLNFTAYRFKLVAIRVGKSSFLLNEKANISLDILTRFIVFKEIRSVIPVLYPFLQFCYKFYSEFLFIDK